MNTDQFSDVRILAMTAYGENRGGGDEGMQSVMNVVCNRVNSGITWWGNDVRSVCLKHLQFSCWLPVDPNYEVILNASDDDLPLSMAQDAIDGKLTDITSGATYYIAESIKTWPKWAINHVPCAKIAGQLFFNDIDS